jgi:putative tryptophan/tyrosine transport system substrate-binding protein
VRRREFITLIGGAVATWPLAARAQQPAVPVIGAPTIGVLNYAAAHDIRVSQFLNALRDLGYVEGRNLAIIQRHADGVLDRLPQLAAELVGANVDLIIALGPAVWAAKQATTTIPIVIDGELLCRALTKCSRIAVLYNPEEPATTLEFEETEAAAGRLGVSLQPVVARHADELEQAFAGAEHGRVDGVLVFTHGFAVLNRARIMQLASQQGLPTMYGWRDFVEEGGLISYGPDIQILVRQAAINVHRILRGERPSNLPVQQPTRLELIINLKTAKALGLEVPPTLLAIADEVIE